MNTREMENDCNFGKIPDRVIEYVNEHRSTQTLYVGWYQKRGNVLRIFAYRWKKMEELMIKEVIRKSPDEEGLVVRDMYLTAMCGWKVLFSRQRKKSYNWYGYCYYDIREEDYGCWNWYDKIGIRYPVINPEILKETEFEYCGWSEKIGMDLVDYLRLWKEHPEVEYFGKIGLYPKKSLLNKVKKDKGFAKFLWNNRDVEWQYYLASDIIRAYDKHISLEEGREIGEEKRSADSFCREIRALKGLKVDRVKIYRYCIKNGINGAYSDYLDAIMNLGMDLEDTKNLFPKDFRRMHDLRINEWASEKAKRDQRERRKLSIRFKEAAENYQKYAFQDGSFCIVIPKGIRDLQHEGKILKHCVGKMGYDVKMVNGTSFIAFLRKMDDPGTPYVTIEFDLKRKIIQQIYGVHDSRPNEEVIEWAKVWERKVKKEMVG